MLTPTEAEEQRSSAKPLTRGTPLDHSCGRVVRRALERRRVQQRCPRGFSSAALGRRPQNRTTGADPRTGNHKGETCFCPGVLSSPCPGLPVAGLSWFRVAGSRALPLRVPVWLLSSSCFFPLAAAPSGRDVGSNSKNRSFQVSPFTWYFLTQRSLCPDWRSVRGSVRVRPWWRTFSLKGLFDYVCCSVSSSLC